jgi:hypothetical protein
VFPVRYGQTYRLWLSFKQKTGQWIMSRIVIVILIFQRHKPINRDYFLSLFYMKSPFKNLVRRRKTRNFMGME